MGTRDVAVRASGGSDNAHLAVSYHWRDTGGFNIAPVGRRERRLPPRHAHASAAERSCCPASPSTSPCATATRLPTATASATPARQARLRPPIDDRSHARAQGAPGRRQPALGYAGRQAHPGAPRQPQRHHHGGHRPLVLPAFTKNTSETDKLAYLATYRLDTPGLWAKHSFSGRVEKEDERFTPEGDLRRRPAARARPHGLHGRMARRLRRPAVPHRRHPPRRQRQLPGFHDLAHAPPRWCCPSSTPARTPASARP